MHMKKEMKAISTLFVILLILCSLIVGALISYMWVMASYYNMPQDSTELAVEDIRFSVTDFSYFGLTVLNPSNSALDVNITRFDVRIESRNATQTVGTVEPALPFLISKGTRQTFKCIKNWGGFAGETIRIEPVAANASIRTPSYTTPKAKLTVTPVFYPSISVAYFNLTLGNSAESATNLTISEIRLFRESINVTPALPRVLAPNENVTFGCERNWEDVRGQNVTITVETVEGYEMIYITDKLPSATVYIDKVEFDYADTSYFNAIIRSSEDSTESVTLTTVNLTLANGTTITPRTLPPLNVIPIPVLPNTSLTTKCLWDWNANRNETIVVSAYTKEGFTISNKTATTPISLIWNITDVKFDLADTEHFLVNVTNLPTSLQDLNITQIGFNGNETISSSQIIPSGESRQFNCTISWKDFVGKNVTITAYDSTGQNNSESIVVPIVDLRIVHIVFDDVEGNAEVRITIANSAFSTKNVTINSISIVTTNTTTPIAIGPGGRPVNIGADTTIACPYNWHDVSTQQLKITIETAEQITISQSILVP